MKNKKKLLIAFLAVVCVICTTAMAATFTTKASEKLLVLKEVDYLKSTITVKSSEGDSVVYFSDSSKKTWEQVPGTVNADGTITLDISWVSVSKNYVLTFKGDKSTGILSVTLPKQVTNFKASFNKVNGNVSFSNAGSRTIQWRKKDSSTWSNVNTSTLSSELESLYTNGASIIFRLAPTNGADGSVGARPSKEVTVAIPKKTTAPSVIVDGSKLTIPVKAGMSYRYVTEDGKENKWVEVTSNDDLTLAKYASSVLYAKDSKQSEVVMQFRTDATSSKQVSQIATVTITTQAAPPDADDEGVLLSYSSSSTISLQVKSATSSIPYEYTIVEKGNTLDLLTASWTSITSSTAVSISNTKAPEGSHIYVRKKAKAATATTELVLASAYLDVTGESGAKYPIAAKISGLTTLVSIAGVCNTGNTDGNLTFTMYSPTKTTIQKITFKDAYGVSKGEVTVKSTVTANTQKTGSEDAYIITGKITSTEKLDGITEELLYADITLENTDVIESTKSNGIALYLYDASKVANPEEDGYSTSFNRVLGSKESSDESSFSFLVEFGTDKLPDTEKYGNFTSTATAIKSITYDGYTLVEGTDYIVTAGKDTNSSGEAVATATVKIDVKEFEKNTKIKVRDTDEYFVITLNNKEIIKKSVKMKLVTTATIQESPIAWAFTAGSLKETATKTVTDEDKNTTTVVEEVNSYTLVLNIFDKNYEVTVTDVTFDGTSVMHSANLADGKITVVLSNKKINKLTTTSSTTNNLVFHLSNGYEITTGCKMTILKPLVSE